MIEVSIRITDENNKTYKNVTLSDYSLSIDSTINEVGFLLKDAVSSLGYHPNNVTDLFNLEG